jgi:type II secretory pathway component GspD/PulD (secretin)
MKPTSFMTTPFLANAFRRTIPLALTLMLATTALMPPQQAFSQNIDDGTYTDLAISVPGGTKRTRIDVSEESVRTVLRNLAMQAGCNLVVDESVDGNISLTLNNVPINQALQSIAAIADLQIIHRTGNIYLVLTKDAAKEKGLNRLMSKVIPVKYANAMRLAKILNNSVFVEPGAAQAASNTSASNQRVRADARTNSLIVIGSQRELELATEAVQRLDHPRETKTFFLSHANALDAATIISSSVFNYGTNPLTLQGSGGGGGGGASGGGAGGGQQNQDSQMSSLIVEQENIQEGNGINNFGGTGQGGGGGAGGAGGATNGSPSLGALSQNVTLRGTVKSTQVAMVSPEGPMVIPDTRANSVTVFGTAEQIAAVERLIPVIDAQLPQVSIEASLVEISEVGVKQLSNQLGLAGGQLQLGFNNNFVNNVRSNAFSNSAGTIIGLPTVQASDAQAYGRSGISYTTRPLITERDVVFQIRSLLTEKKAKMLANPTIVATHDTEAIISIVDEIIRRTTIQQNGSSNFITLQPEYGEAGIVLDILPKIGEDGTVSLRVRPSVSTIKEVAVQEDGGLVTLLSKRDLLTQSVRMKDGETLLIGGLVQEEDTTRVDKLPGLANLPIVGALGRASARNGKRTELVLMITPHIMNKTRLTAPIFTAPSLSDGEAGGAAANFQPVSTQPAP